MLTSCARQQPADLVLIVLDRDALTIAPEQLLHTQVDLTIVGGKVVFDRRPLTHE